jgi:hypothetical protein
LFFRKRKREDVSPVLDSGMVQTLPQNQNREYKTNYFTSKRKKHRGSPRCKSQRKEEIGEYKIEVELGQLPKNYVLISNLFLKTDQGIEHIDHLVVSPYGLFMIEVNNLSGIILGEERDVNWHQVVTWRVKTFPNSLLENQAHLETLRKWVNLEETLPVFSFATFNRRCDLKVISGAVFYDTDILTVIRKRSQREVLTDAEVLKLCTQIRQANITDPNLRNEYTARQRKQRIRQRPKYGDIRCRTCQKAVSERTARYCINHPDKFAWQIYCVKHQKELNK